MAEPGFTFVLQVKNQIQDPFLDILEAFTDGDYILLNWTIKKHDCAVLGKMQTSILIQRQNQLNPDDANVEIIKQTYIAEFECVVGVSAKEYLQDTPPSIYEQAILQTLANASIAAAEANRAKGYADALMTELITRANNISYYNGYLQLLSDDVPIGDAVYIPGGGVSGSVQSVDGIPPNETTQDIPLSLFYDTEEDAEADIDGMVENTRVITFEC